MLNTKTLKKLIIVTIVCLAPVILMVAKSGISFIKGKNALFMPGLLKKPEQITKVVLQYNRQTFTLQKVDNNWQITEKHGYPVMNAKVEALLNGLANLRIVEPKTSNPEFYKQLDLNNISELDSQALLITISDMYNDELVKLYVGKREGIHVEEEYQERIFVRRADEAQTWLVQGLIPSSNDFADWAEQSLLSIIDGAQIKSVEIKTLPTNKVVIYKDDPEQGDFKIDGLQVKNGMVLDLDMVNTVPSELADLEFKNVYRFDTLNTNWENTVSAIVDTFLGIKVTINMLKDGEKIYAKAHAESVADVPVDLQQKVDAFNASKQQWVYELPIEFYKAICLSNNDFLKPEIQAQDIIAQ